MSKIQGFGLSPHNKIGGNRHRHRRNRCYYVYLLILLTTNTEKYVPKLNITCVCLDISSVQSLPFIYKPKIIFQHAMNIF